MDDLSGLPCTLSGFEGQTRLRYDFYGAVDIECAGDFVWLQKETARAQEDAGHVVFTVRLSRPRDVPVSFDYRTFSTSSPDAAQPGVDYVPTDGHIVFEPGETSKTIAVEIIDDTIDESNAYANTEAFAISFENLVNAIWTGNARGEILDNDAP